MTRFLLLAFLFGLVWRSLARLTGGRPDRQARPKGPEAEARIDSLVACAGCGVYHPASRMVVQGGERFCSEDCLRSRPRPAEAS